MQSHHADALRKLAGEAPADVVVDTQPLPKPSVMRAIPSIINSVAVTKLCAFGLRFFVCSLCTIILTRELTGYLMGSLR